MMRSGAPFISTKCWLFCSGACVTVMAHLLTLLNGISCSAGNASRNSPTGISASTYRSRAASDASPSTVRVSVRPLGGSAGGACEVSSPMVAALAITVALDSARAMTESRSSCCLLALCDTVAAEGAAATPADAVVSVSCVSAANVARLQMAATVMRRVKPLAAAHRTLVMPAKL